MKIKIIELMSKSGLKYSLDLNEYVFPEEYSKSDVMLDLFLHKYLYVKPTSDIGTKILIADDISTIYIVENKELV